ncbi:MAG: 2-dehydropantoate 2-reductase [Deltaproteobacteria bacterium]|nr:2-dehydropantoate 2-reductase [Deltaproteobacteria bacterium]
MNFLIVGPGAMGCLFAARLNKAGYNVTLLDYIPERARKISEQGIMVEGISGEYTVNVPVVTGAIPFQPDFVLICVKSNKTGEASHTIKSMLGPEPVVVTLQNGVGNLEILEELFGSERVLGGVTAEGATLLGWGKTKHAGQGDTIMGPKGDPGSPAEKIISAFNKAGFKTRSEDNVDDLIWGKLIINVGINALTAITGLKNGRLPELDSTRMIMEEAVSEAVAVAKAKGIQLPFPDPLERVMKVCRDTAGNIASMLQDVLYEKVTEIDFINGAIVREGKVFGIPTPVNNTLTSLVQAIRDTYQERE